MCKQLKYIITSITQSRGSEAADKAIIAQDVAYVDPKAIAQLQDSVIHESAHATCKFKRRIN